MKTMLMVVSGFSCTGKTTLTKTISKRYSTPVISRDAIQESLYDSLGYSARERSKKLGIALIYLQKNFLLTSDR